MFFIVNLRREINKKFEISIKNQIINKSLNIKEIKLNINIFIKIKYFINKLYKIIIIINLKYLI